MWAIICKKIEFGYTLQIKLVPLKILIPGLVNDQKPNSKGFFGQISIKLCT